MAGCGMIGQSVINVKSGGRGRLSTFVAGAFLLVHYRFTRCRFSNSNGSSRWCHVYGLCSTFDWSTIRLLRKAPMTDSIVMIVTVMTVLATGDLSKGVLAGVILSAVFFVVKISKLKLYLILVINKRIIYS